MVLELQKVVTIFSVTTVTKMYTRGTAEKKWYGMMTMTVTYRSSICLKYRNKLANWYPCSSFFDFSTLQLILYNILYLIRVIYNFKLLYGETSNGLNWP
jgi:hypothetical protein